MTLNQIREQLELIAQNHKQINSFGFGDIWEQNTSGSIDYPMLWVTLENSVVANKVQTMNFKFVFMDLVGNGEQNENDVLSDQLEIAKDVIAQLQHPNYTWSFDAENVALEDFTERLTDSVSGWVADIALDLPYTFDRCSMPYTGNTSANAACPSVTIFDSNGNIVTTVSAGGSYTVSVGADATVRNSDSTYTNTVASGGTLVTPDVLFSIDNSIGNYISSYYPSVKDVTVTLSDTQYDIYVNGTFNQTVSLPALQDDTITINAV